MLTAAPGTGYQAGDMIAIKINQNNSDAPAADHGNAMNANPQTCVAVVASLVNAGVPQADIWIGDPSRAVTDNIFNAIHKAFPNVKVVDYFGNNGRVTTTNVDGVFPNNDVKNSESACFYNARYIINQPLLKGHVGTDHHVRVKEFLRDQRHPAQLAGQQKASRQQRPDRLYDQREFRRQSRFVVHGRDVSEPEAGRRSIQRSDLAAL